MSAFGIKEQGLGVELVDLGGTQLYALKEQFTPQSIFLIAVGMGGVLMV